MRKFWIGAAAVLAVAGLAAGDLQASMPIVKSNITVADEKPAPKKKKLVVLEKKPDVKKDRYLATRQPCDGFFECLFNTRRTTTGLLACPTERCFTNDSRTRWALRNTRLNQWPRWLWT